MSFRAAQDDMVFTLEHVVDYARLKEAFPEADLDTVTMMIDAAAKIAEGAFLPLRHKMDQNPARIQDGEVVLPEGVGEALQAVYEAGLAGLAAPAEYGGLEMPVALLSASNEALAGANLALQLNPLLTQGQIEALHAHGSEELKAEILPMLISGEWTGTMLLTEAQAGSDLGALKTKAVAANDGSYRLSGQKIFITWGEHPYAKNISHLTLARLEGAPEGAKGISLFFVPKFLPDGTRNDVGAISLEEKMGIHGSPTCVMELDGAKGWLVGEENQGLKAMFTMMNNARLGVAMQGVGMAEASYQAAAEYARERVQGAAAITGTIIDHADVRRMLTQMRAKVLVARALAYDCAIAIDLGKTDKKMKARAGVLTPLAKTYCTEIALENAQDCVQVFGGMGYVEETGVAQFYRDARILPIYEGTNGIQAMDLIGRKMADDGVAIFDLLDELENDIFEHDLRNATKALLAREHQLRAGDAADYLRCFAEVLGLNYLKKGAEHSMLWKGLALDFETRVLPATRARLLAITKAPRALYLLNADAF